MTDNKGPDDYRNSYSELHKSWFYLKWRKVIPCGNMKKAENSLCYGKKRVRLTKINKDLHVSTVFLYLNHNWREGSEPIVFETAIIERGEFDIRERCSTWKQALAMHWRAVKDARKTL